MNTLGHFLLIAAGFWLGLALPTLVGTVGYVP